jgi:hypothetical protein
LAAGSNDLTDEKTGLVFVAVMATNDEVRRLKEHLDLSRKRENEYQTWQ